ncbi:hypothetical protein NDU88_004141 [Pleurodeles waltl]|uniref:Uncharacterized protein n=1 Tax=Pleurodeles waltl TaxID=8319 RepID=A0AAV7KWX0_PLEWA|nr:hypothetical protein NDU88_004141 [Pleurodeles waltl]
MVSVWIDRLRGLWGRAAGSCWAWRPGGRVGWLSGHWECGGSLLCCVPGFAGLDGPRWGLLTASGATVDAPGGKGGGGPEEGDWAEAGWTAGRKSGLPELDVELRTTCGFAGPGFPTFGVVGLAWSWTEIGGRRSEDRCWKDWLGRGALWCLWTRTVRPVYVDCILTALAVNSLAEGCQLHDGESGTETSEDLLDGGRKKEGAPTFQPEEMALAGKTADGAVCFPFRLPCSSLLIVLLFFALRAQILSVAGSALCYL